MAYAPPVVDRPAPSLVLLHVYDVTNAPSDALNATVSAINGLTRGLLGVGGVFHGGLEVYAREWAFGACESGSGVYPCRPRANPMYKYRETVVLGPTACGEEEVAAIVERLSAEWSGTSYDLLTRNCVHFTSALAQELGVQQPPAWVNAAAGAADGAARAASTAAKAAASAAKAATDAAKWLVERATASASAAGGGEGSTGGGSVNGGGAAAAQPAPK